MEDLGKLATSLHLFSLSQTSGQVFYAFPSHSITQTFGHYITAAVFGNACGPSIDRVMNCTSDFLENQVLMSYVWDGIAYEAPLSLKSSFKSIWSSSARFNWILLKEKVEITSGLCWFSSVAFKRLAGVISLCEADVGFFFEILSLWCH